MKCAQNHFDSLFVLHNIFSLYDAMNLRLPSLSERFRRAEKGVLHQMHDFCSYRIKDGETGTKIHNNSQYDIFSRTSLNQNLCLFTLCMVPASFSNCLSRPVSGILTDCTPLPAPSADHSMPLTSPSLAYRRDLADWSINNTYSTRSLFLNHAFH